MAPPLNNLTVMTDRWNLGGAARAFAAGPRRRTRQQGDAAQRGTALAPGADASRVSVGRRVPHGLGVASRFADRAPVLPRAVGIAVLLGVAVAYLSILWLRFPTSVRRYALHVMRVRSAASSLVAAALILGCAVTIIWMPQIVYQAGDSSIGIATIILANLAVVVAFFVLKLPE